MAKTISSITIILFLLLTSFGVKIDKHYCGNELKTVAFFSSAKPCNMTKKSCHHKGKCKHHSKKDKKNCCHNETEYIVFDNDYTSNDVIDFQAPTPQLLAVFYSFAVQNFLTDEAYTSPFISLKPPLISQDLGLIHQVFII